MLEKIKAVIIDYCENNCFDKTEGGYYRYDLYADYRDTLDNKTVTEILEATDPMQKFYEVLDDAWFEERFERRRYARHERFSSVASC